MVVKSEVIRNCGNHHSPREGLGSEHNMQQKLNGIRITGILGKLRDQKNAGLKAVTLIATLNPVSQVLW